MSSPALRRLIAYVAATLAILTLAELIVRANEELFRAISHRVLTKAELLDRKPPTEIIFFGTSRTWDGVSVRLFAEELATRTKQPATAFNLATTGSSLETLEYLAERFATRPGLKLAMIELTVPQLKQEHRLPWVDPPLPDDAPLEEQLQTFARRHIKLIDLRQMFVGENFARIIPLLFLADRLDGSEVNPKDFMKVARGEQLDTRESEVTWQPEVVLPRNAWPNYDPVGSRLGTIVHLFREHKVDVIFFIPPLRSDDAREERAEKMKILAGDLSTMTGAPIWDFVSAADHQEEDSFRDTSHLSRRGRARFSQSLARALHENPLR